MVDQLVAGHASSGTVPFQAPSRTWLERLWTSIADRGRAYAPVPAGAAGPVDRACQIADLLLSERGEASGAAMARELNLALRALDPEDKLEFYRYLATHFLPDEERLRQAADAYLADPTPGRAAQLAEAAEPPRQELIRRMNLAPGGTAALVAMRRHILEVIAGQPELKPLDTDLRHLFASWFNRGFLELRRIDWNTPAAVLEKLIAYEAVHEIAGWADLRRRLAPDRRCFAFFHPALQGEPLIFVEVALTEGLAGAVQPLLSPGGDEAAQAALGARADAAIFYSISNCQDGLRGVSFGNFLIKQVVEELNSELPQLRLFSTLSPVPGFRRWLERALAEKRGEGEPPLLREDEAAAIMAAWPEPVETPEEAFAALLAARRDWTDPASSEVLKAPLLRLCAKLLTTSTGSRGPTDPVARFHLGNGARLERINWLGNTASRGIVESFGIMVNYLYDRDTIEANHEAFVHASTVARGPAVDALLAPPVPKRSTTGLRLRRG
jgi:malonyl-CoA decarboxylase